MTFKNQIGNGWFWWQCYPLGCKYYLWLKVTNCRHIAALFQDCDNLEVKYAKLFCQKCNLTARSKNISVVFYTFHLIFKSLVVYRPKTEIFNLCKLWMKVWSTTKSNFSLGGTSISPNFDHQCPHPLPRTQFMRSVLRQFFPGTMNVEREEIWKYLILSDLVGCLRLTTLLHQLL